MQFIIASILRHALTTVGGALVAKGIIESAMLEPVVGAAMTLAGVVAGVVNKIRSPQTKG
jgi:hypothetical protein